MIGKSLIIAMVIFSLISPMISNAQVPEDVPGNPEWNNVVASQTNYYFIKPEDGNREVEVVYHGSYSGTEGTRYRFTAYYYVTDLDEDSVDDEHVEFFTKWYYGVIDGSGGGGGGIPMVLDLTFDDIVFYNWRPEDGDGGRPVSVYVGTPWGGVSFTLIRLFGWDVEQEYGTYQGFPSATLDQRTNWLWGNDYDFRNGACAVSTDHNKYTGSIRWGPYFYFKITIEYEIDGQHREATWTWAYPVGLLAS